MGRTIHATRLTTRCRTITIDSSRRTRGRLGVDLELRVDLYMQLDVELGVDLYMQLLVELG